VAGVAVLSLRSRQRHSEWKALQVPHELQNTLYITLPLQHLALNPAAPLLFGKISHLQPDNVVDASPVCNNLPAQELVRLPCFLLTLSATVLHLSTVAALGPLKYFNLVGDEDDIGSECSKWSRASTFSYN